jgi:hypothetical protein
VSLADVRPLEHTSFVTNQAGTANYDPLSVIKTPINTGLQGFGIAVNSSLYTALQTAQNTSGQPSIRRADYASLSNFNGGIKTAGGLLGNSDATPLELARRVATSGTQASSELYFLNAKTAGAQTPVTKDDFPIADIITNGFGVTEGSSTSNVKASLNNTTNYVIGVISLENVPSGSDTYKFVAIDGVSPNEAFDITANAITVDPYNRQTLASGDYSFGYESFVLYKDNALNAAGTPQTAGLAKALSDEIKKTANSNLAGYAYLDAPGTWAAWKSGDGYIGNKNKQSRVSRSGNNLVPLQGF